ncbi:MAG TPA: hypothetical protein PK129_05490 [Cellvibrionaceae bacterium]|nr:hypothetical protein [Cellvibrionaceae bacterium]
MIRRIFSLIFLVLASNSTHAALQFGCNFTVRATAPIAGEVFYRQIPWSGYSPTGGEGCNQQVEYSYNVQEPGLPATTRVSVKSSLTRQGDTWIFDSSATSSTYASANNINSFSDATADISTTINIISSSPFQYSASLEAQGVSLGSRRAFAAARYGIDNAVMAGESSLITLPGYGNQFDYKGDTFSFSGEVSQAPFYAINLGGDAYSRPLYSLGSTHEATFHYRIEFSEITIVPVPPTSYLMVCGLAWICLFKRKLLTFRLSAKII